MPKRIAKKLSENVISGRISFHRALQVMSVADEVISRRLSKSGRFMRRMQLRTLLDSFNPGARRAWTSVLFPAELLHPYEIWPVTLEVIAGIFSTVGVSPSLLSLADGRHIPQTMCTFHRILIGMSESGILPKAEFVGATSQLCDGNSQSFAMAAERLEIPFYFLDIPFESGSDAIIYLRGQLKELAGRLSDLAKSKISDDGWRAQARRVNRAINLHKRFCQSRAAGGFKNLHRGFEVANFAFTYHYLLGHPRLEEILESMCNDVDKGKDARGNYKNLELDTKARRLMWLHIMPQYDTPLWGIIDDGRVAKIVCDEYSAPYMKEYDENDFFGSVARRLIEHPSNGPLLRRIEHIIKTAKAHHVDGAIHYSSWGCHQAAGNVGIVESAFRSEGIPFVNLSGDAADFRNSSFEQHKTRLEAFLEQLS